MGEVDGNIWDMTKEMPPMITSPEEAERRARTMRIMKQRKADALPKESETRPRITMPSPPVADDVFDFAASDEDTTEDSEPISGPIRIAIPKIAEPESTGFIRLNNLEEDEK